MSIIFISHVYFNYVNLYANVGKGNKFLRVFFLSLFVLHIYIYAYFMYFDTFGVG